jgi:acetyl-CoA carboxylase, biotin carboxylase subunit
MFKRILVANRGEIALRVIRACRSLGVESVAVFSQADAQSPHLEEADARVCIGPGPSGLSYLNQDALLQAAEQMECQAIHPGYGFLSENASFAARCGQQKTTFIGPSARCLRLMGDKVQARRTMERFGVHGVPGSPGLVLSVEEAAQVAAEIGFPVLLKATAGGGGKGMRICRAPEELETAFEQASLEALTSFGNGGLYLERFIEGGRHIEFQLLADRYGQVVHLGERECSTQRSNQKVIEEAPSPGVTEEQRETIGAQLCAVVKEIGYVGVGTVEFLRAPDGALYFMEMNTRLQVEHPVTEMVTQVDLVSWQLQVAAGRPLTLSQEDVHLDGHAIECRINAEDPTLNFRPSPGLITRFDAPADWRYALEGPVRLDSHVRSGYRVPTLYDSMLAKLIVHAADRPSAISQMCDALERLQIEGVVTTKALHAYLLNSPSFSSGQYSTASMSEVMKRFTSMDTESPEPSTAPERTSSNG